MMNVHWLLQIDPTHKPKVDYLEFLHFIISYLANQRPTVGLSREVSLTHSSVMSSLRYEVTLWGDWVAIKNKDFLYITLSCIFRASI